MIHAPLVALRFALPMLASAADLPARRSAAAICFAFALLAPAATASAGSEKHPWNQGVPFETATIRYELKGTDPGTKVLYIRKRGDERVTITRTRPANSADQAERHTIEISTPAELTRIEMGTKTGLRANNRLGFYLEAYKGLSDADKAAVMTAASLPENRFSVLRGNAPAPLPKADVLGHKCEIVEVGGVTNYYLEGTTILLKSEGTQGEFQVSTVATEVDTKTPVPDDVFAVPADVRVRDLREASSASTRSSVEKELGAWRVPHP